MKRLWMYVAFGVTVALLYVQALLPSWAGRAPYCSTSQLAGFSFWPLVVVGIGVTVVLALRQDSKRIKVFVIAFALLIMAISSYFSVLDSDFRPQKCIFGSGIECTDFFGVVEDGSGTIMVDLLNGRQTDVFIKSVEVRAIPLCQRLYRHDVLCEPCGEDGCGLAGNWLKGETKSLSVSCPGLTADDRVLLSVVMSHDSEGRP
ncbi:MAG: hypothetical protein ABIH41_05885, partial [Nanoarchaeota archaeon]